MDTNDKNKVETILFTTGGFVRVEELSKMTGIASIGYLKETIHALQQDYQQRDSALLIVEQGDQWKIAIRKNYLYLTQSLLNDSELDRPTQETLAIVAYKTPIMQNDLIKIRGNKAYEHIHTLKELAFVVSEKSGRTRILKVTQKFYDYFDVVEDQLKSKFAALDQKLPETTKNSSPPEIPPVTSETLPEQPSAEPSDTTSNENP